MSIKSRQFVRDTKSQPHQIVTEDIYPPSSFLEKDESSKISLSVRSPGPSCQALKHAVSNIYPYDDFIKEKIGEGFFSEVYKVTHKVSGQVMALKVNKSLDNRSNMLKEVQLMNKLFHPNILRYHGACVHERQLHSLTEYVNGGNLEQLICDKNEELPWDLRFKLACDISKGMRYVHAKGLIHRDLTSKNILIKKDHDISNNKQMTAIVADFGLAAKIPNPLNNNPKLSIVGSPFWMAPECLNGFPYNEKADIFSFGIVLCESIARIVADPDILPRTEKFGLDYVAFSNMVTDCPLSFLRLAFDCCQSEPQKRPAFKEIVDSLETEKSRSQFADVIADITNLNEKNSTLNKTMLNHILEEKRIVSNSKNNYDDLENNADKYVFDSKVEKTYLSVTSQTVGDVMSKDDAYYVPHVSNPFAVRYKDIPKIITREKWLSFTDVSVLSSPGCPCFETNPQTDSSMRKWRKSQSLPSSPEMHRRDLDLMFFTQSSAKNVSFNSGKKSDGEEDNFDVLSEGGSSNDSAIDLKLDAFTSRLSRQLYSIRRRVCSDMDNNPRSDKCKHVGQFNKQIGLPGKIKNWNCSHLSRTEQIIRCLEAQFAPCLNHLNYSFKNQQYRMMDDKNDLSLHCCSPSESFLSLDESSLLSPTSSLSSYSECDSDFSLYSHIDGHDARQRSKERFQELVKEWEAKQLQAVISKRNAENVVVSRPDPPDYRLELKFQELKKRWEQKQAVNKSFNRSKLSYEN